MKFLSTAAILAVAIRAEDEVVPTPGLRKITMTRDMLSIATNMTPNESKAYLSRYGCYCYAKGSKVTGSTNKYNGPGMDDLDSLCRELTRAQRCLHLDSEAGVYPKECGATDNFSWYHENGSIICGKENDPSWATKNPCKYQLCLTERDFVLKVDSLIKSGFNKDDNLHFSVSDYEATCENQSSNQVAGGELKCCGNGVDRKTFNSIVNECCGGENVKPIGLCV